MELSEDCLCVMCKKNLKNGQSRRCIYCQNKIVRERKIKYKKESLNKLNTIRNEVYKRDKFQCSFCKTKEKLLIHHKDESGEGSYSNNKTKVNNEMDNLISLCFRCHSELHTWLSRIRRHKLLT